MRDLHWVWYAGIVLGVFVAGWSAHGLWGAEWVLPHNLMAMDRYESGYHDGYAAGVEAEYGWIADGCVRGYLTCYALPFGGIIALMVGVGLGLGVYARVSTPRPVRIMVDLNGTAHDVVADWEVGPRD